MKIDFNLCDKGTVIHVPKSDKQFAVYAKSLGATFDTKTDAYYVKPVLAPVLLQIAQESYELTFAGQPDKEQMKVIASLDDVAIDFRTSKRNPSFAVDETVECKVKKYKNGKSLIITPEKNETVRSAIRQADGVHVRDVGWIVPTDAEYYSKAIDTCKTFWKVKTMRACKADEIALDLAHKKQQKQAARKQLDQAKIIIGSVYLKYRKTLPKECQSDLLEMFDERVGKDHVREALGLPALEKVQ